MLMWNTSQLKIHGKEYFPEYNLKKKHLVFVKISLIIIIIMIIKIMCVCLTTHRTL